MAEPLTVNTLQTTPSFADATLSQVANARDYILQSAEPYMETLADKVNGLIDSWPFNELPLETVLYTSQIFLGFGSGAKSFDALYSLGSGQFKSAIKNATVATGMGFTAVLLTSSPVAIALVAKSFTAGAAVKLAATLIQRCIDRRDVKQVKPQGSGSSESKDKSSQAKTKPTFKRPPETPSEGGVARLKIELAGKLPGFKADPTVSSAGAVAAQSSA